ncbi:MAG: tryptophan synthase subunit alpha, partial [Simkaniaceae bacterium]|nr:tryptophan synthase subunit alpha [Simkaniaceae bacterium]
MSRISDVFNRIKPFIGFLIAGDGGMEKCYEDILALVKGGVDIIELGIPFSDPVADGSVIQKGAERALKKAFVTPKKILDLVTKIRQKVDTPIILLSYYNPILTAGPSFLEEAK